jgi:hypothetical protein
MFRLILHTQTHARARTHTHTHTHTHFLIKLITYFFGTKLRGTIKTDSFRHGSLYYIYIYIYIYIYVADQNRNAEGAEDKRRSLENRGAICRSRSRCGALGRGLPSPRRYIGSEEVS